MAARAADDGTEAPASIGRLVASIKDDMTALMRDEIELAKAELREDAKAAAIGGALATMGAVLAMVGFLLGSVALVYGVSALGLTRGWSFLIVAGFYVLVAGALFLVAKGRFDRISKAERAKMAARHTVHAIRPSHARPQRDDVAQTSPQQT